MIPRLLCRRGLPPRAYRCNISSHRMGSSSSASASATTNFASRSISAVPIKAARSASCRVESTGAMNFSRSSSTSATSSPSPSIQKLLDFIQLYGRVEGFVPRPGFATAALGLSYEYISKHVHNVRYDDASQTLKLRFPLSDLPTLSSSTTAAAATMARPANTAADSSPSRSPSLHQNHHRPSLSTYLALMDDITTWALVLADVKGGRAGKSVTFHAAWNPMYRYSTCQHSTTAADSETASSIPTTKDSKENVVNETVVEFTARVQKIGQNIGFVNAQVHDVTNAQGEIHHPASSHDHDQYPLICYGSQVKFMPMGTVVDFALSPAGWELTKLYSKYILSRRDEPPNAAASADVGHVYQTFELLDFQSEAAAAAAAAAAASTGTSSAAVVVAQFTPSKEHSSLGGPIHGGCQAVLMELAATAYCHAVTAAKDSSASILGSRPTDKSSTSSNHHDSAVWTLDSMSINYMSAPKSSIVYLTVAAVADNASSSNSTHAVNHQDVVIAPTRRSLRVQLVSSRSSNQNDAAATKRPVVVYSEGLLHFTLQ